MGQVVSPAIAPQIVFHDTSGAGSVVAVDAYDNTGTLVPFADSAGVKWPYALITVPTSGNASIGYGVLQYKPDGTHFLTAMGSTVSQVTMFVVSGSVTVNTSGTKDGSAGSGNGVLSTSVAPGASSPWNFAAKETWSYSVAGKTFVRIVGASIGGVGGAVTQGTSPWVVGTGVSGFPDGWSVTHGTKADAAVTNPALSASQIALLKGLLTLLTSITANQTNGTQKGQLVDASGNPVGSTAAGSTAMLTASAGSVLTSQSSDFAGGTDWTSGSSTALPANIKAVWIGIVPSATCSIKVDAGGATGIVFQNVQGGWWPLPNGLHPTKIYAPANGSTGAANLVVLS